MREFDIERLRCLCPSQAFWVDLRVMSVGFGCWLASVDTPDGPTMAVDTTRIGAVLAAVEPFHDVVPELLENQRHL